VTVRSRLAALAVAAGGGSGGGEGEGGEVAVGRRRQNLTHSRDRRSVREWLPGLVPNEPARLGQGQGPGQGQARPGFRARARPGQGQARPGPLVSWFCNVPPSHSVPKKPGQG
jgi:hypothetical protein